MTEIGGRKLSSRLQPVLSTDDAILPIKMHDLNKSMDYICILAMSRLVCQRCLLIC